MCGVSSICAYVLDRGQHRLLDGQSRPPPECANAGTIQQDKRAVADPPAFASRVRQLGMQSEMLANPPDGVIDLAVFVSPKIENVHLRIRPLNGDKNRIDAILHVQIRFALTAVAQHMEMIRMFDKLLVEIEHVPVRVTLSQNRYESKNVALHSEAFAVGLNQAFRS